MLFRHSHFVTPVSFTGWCQFRAFLILVFGSHVGADEVTKHLKSILKRRKLLTLKEGESILPSLHGPCHRLRVVFGLWPLEWLQNRSPDAWKVLESTLLSVALHCYWPSLEASSIDGITVWCKMPASGPVLCCGCFLFVFAMTAVFRCLVSLIDKLNFQQLWIVSLYLLFLFVTFIMFDRKKQNSILFSLSRCCLHLNSSANKRGFISSSIQTTVGSAVIQCLMYGGTEIPLNLVR